MDKTLNLKVKGPSVTAYFLIKIRPEPWWELSDCLILIDGITVSVVGSWERGYKGLIKEREKPDLFTAEEA